MKILHISSIFEGGLRQAIFDYVSIPVDQYKNIIWRCGRNNEKGRGERVFPQTIKPFNFSLSMMRYAWRCSDSADIVHHHGCWSFTSMAALLLKSRHGLPLVYSPHGAFIPASLERYCSIKLGFLRLWERRVLRSVDCFHAVSEKEVESIKLIAKDKPVALIPNGINLEKIPLQPRSFAFWDRWGIPRERFKVLFLSRLVPDKGLDLLLLAMQQVIRENPHVHCIVVGEGPRSYQTELSKIILQAELGAHVSMIGPLAGEETFAAYRNVDLFVLPSRNEAHPLVVLESLSQETPVLASRNTPYASLVEFKCGWWEDNDPVTLARVLISASLMERKVLREMGLNCRKLLAERYSLSRVHAQLGELYEWVAAGMAPTDQPVTVSSRTDAI